MSTHRASCGLVAGRQRSPSVSIRDHAHRSYPASRAPIRALERDGGGLAATTGRRRNASGIRCCPRSHLDTVITSISLDLDDGDPYGLRDGVVHDLDLLVLTTGSGGDVLDGRVTFRATGRFGR